MDILVSLSIAMDNYGTWMTMVHRNRWFMNIDDDSPKKNLVIFQFATWNITRGSFDDIPIKPY